MPCDTRTKRGQSLQERATEVKAVTQKVSARILDGRVKVIIDKKTGAIAFDGLTAYDRDDVTDACIYRRMMATAPVTVKLAIQKAEQMAGRAVSTQALAAGVHSHDGGKSWGSH